MSDAAIDERRARLALLRQAPGGAYPNDFERTHLVAQLAQSHGAVDAEELAAQQRLATVAGRLMRRRGDGIGIIHDASGSIALAVSAENAGRAGATQFAECDIGDVVGARGFLFKLPGGELALRVHDFHLLVKSLRPLPGDDGAAASPEDRGRNRPVDLLVNQRSRAGFMTRFRLVHAIRAFFGGTDYMEVETPILQAFPAPRGTPQCSTLHNALERRLFLRATPGANLRRLLVGGMDKVFEMNRNFVGGQAAVDGNPEVTTLDICCTYSNHMYMATLVERLLGYAINAAAGDAAPGAGKPFRRLTVPEALRLHAPAWTDAQLRDAAFLRAGLADAGGAAPAEDGWGALQLRLLDAVAATQFVEPCFVFDLPAADGPPARRKDEDPALAERFRLYFGGRLVAEGGSELNDPEAWARHWRDPADIDPDYLRALEYGMPPSSGACVHIDALLAVLTGSTSIRDVILFPHDAAARPGG